MKLVTSGWCKTGANWIQLKSLKFGTPFWSKKTLLKGFWIILNSTNFLTIFVNLWKRLESAVLAGQCKFSVKPIICKKVGKKILH